MKTVEKTSSAKSYIFVYLDRSWFYANKKWTSKMKLAPEQNLRRRNKAGYLWADTSWAE